MKVLEINSGNFGSTGNIMLDIAKEADRHGIDVTVAYPKSRTSNKKKVEKVINTGGILDHNLHRFVATITGKNGLYSKRATQKFIKQVEELNPDIIHLHNIHNFYLYIPFLLKYIRDNNKKVIWTFHDCWPFTGKCVHYSLIKCERWKTGCHGCPQIRDYPESIVDITREMWKLKREWFTCIDNLIIITPSKWLENQVKGSFLRNKRIETIYNGIDLHKFKYRNNDIKERYGIPHNVYLILGVAFDWGLRKGLDVFNSLSERLPADKYKILLVGVTNDVKANVNSSIITVTRTQNQEELAEMYSAADVFLNPTREEVFGLVNVEALACGTPGITFNSGGSPECYDELSGEIVHDNIDEIVEKIISICETRKFNSQDCIERAKKFDKELMVKRYIDLYKEIGEE